MPARHDPPTTAAGDAAAEPVAGSLPGAVPPTRGLPAPPRSAARRLAAALYRHPRTQLAILLSAPLGWLLIAYIGALVLLFISAFWRLDPFSGDIVTEPTLQNF